MTAWHVLRGAEHVQVFDADGNVASLQKGGLKKKSDELDLAIVELSSSLHGRPVAYGDDDSGLQDMKGVLVSMFTGKAEFYRTGYDTRWTAWDLRQFNGRVRTFRSDHETKEGYSGSPVFNGKGHLVTILTAGYKEKFAGMPSPEEGIHNFCAPSAARATTFIKQSLGLD